MQIWVDADGCPGEVKELVYRAAKRRQMMVTLVANQPLRIPASPYITSIRVGEGSNVADQEIVERLQPGDLVITTDIPLAADVVAKGGHALNPRGEMYTSTNVGERLALRNLLDGLRGGTTVTDGPAPFNARNRQAFANQLDRWLAKAQAKPN